MNECAFRWDGRGNRPALDFNHAPDPRSMGWVKETAYWRRRDNAHTKEERPDRSWRAWCELPNAKVAR